MSNPGVEARALLRGQSLGMLATHSLELPGYPFGSVTPYALDDAMQPLLLLSDIAQHTANVKADPRASLLVLDVGAIDHQAAARLTWVGDIERVADDDERAHERYVGYFPKSARYREAHDFHLYRVGLKRARYIGGFGDIHWLRSEQLVLENSLRTVGKGIVAHMNKDHVDAMQTMCEARGGARPSSVQMIGVDPEGCDLLADGRRARFAFAELVFTPNDARTAIIALLQRAREQLADRTQPNEG
jgi:putative heme iron utilization protein